MTVHYLDSSVWIKRFLHEPDSPSVVRWFEGKPRIATATISLIEVVSVLGRRQKAGRLSMHRFDEVTRRADEDFETFTKIPLDADVLRLCRNAGRVYTLKPADTIHLVSAMHLRWALAEGDEHVIFVTSDQELASAASLARFPVTDAAAL